MTEISNMGAIDLHNAVGRALFEDDDALADALTEVERLRSVLIEIIDMVNTDPVTYRSSSIDDYDKLLRKIDDEAHKYFLP
jgi:hypothetical protein